MAPLKNFLSPKTIAVIGASDHQDKVGGILSKKISQSKVKFIPINPNHEKLFGVRCYGKVLEYSGSIDLAIIAIPAPFVAQAFEECGKKGIKDVAIISSGFSEIQNIKGEQEIKRIAQKYKIRFLGPNCFGICNPYKNLDATFSVASLEKGNIAFISQSGALWSYIADIITGKDELGISGFISLGNMEDLEFSDFIEYFSKDSNTSSMVLYIERLKNGKRFISSCQRCKKPIYAVKAGSSSEGSKAAISHTASIASDYEIYKGAFRQAGVILCDSLIDAFEKASGNRLLEFANKEAVKIAKRVFIVTNAGGAGVLLADYLSKKGFEIAREPLDLLGTATSLNYAEVLQKVKNDSAFDSIIIILTPQSMSQIKETAEAIAHFKKETNKSVVALFLGAKSMKEANESFKSNKILYFNTLEEARARLVF